MRTLFLVSFLILSHLFPSVSWAAQNNNDPKKFEEINNRLQKIEEKQDEQMEKLEEILVRLDKLKILVRRF